MESEEQLFKREIREQRNREDREPVNSPPVCHDCGDLIEGEYFEYTYNSTRGKPITENYCEDCREDFFAEFEMQGRRNTNDIR